METVLDRDRVHRLGDRLLRLVEERKTQRQSVENRWLEDLEQYLGVYDPETKKKLNEDPTRSQVFINITRNKTNAAEARLSDMLLPNDDRNWSVAETPVAEIEGMEESLGETLAEQAREQLQAEARKRARLMMEEIDDQLVECDYAGLCRQAIHDACVFGTGILKGAVTVARTEKRWDELAPGVTVLRLEEEFRPAVEHVMVWDFFPDLSARCLEECESILERKYVTRRQLIELARRPGFFADEIRQVLAEDAEGNRASVPSHLARLRDMTLGSQNNLLPHRYELWEYHGPLSKDDLAACGVEPPDDELEEFEAVVLFVNGRVIRASLTTLDTGERPYALFVYERDDSSVLGYGVPFLLRQVQRVVNGTWRIMMENAALCSRGQVVLNQEVVRPVNGSWNLTPGKLWTVNEQGMTAQQAFSVFEFNSHQAELAGIFEMARQLADEITALPMLAQGEQGHAPDTASGMSMMMNSANTVLRRIVKQFDDGITKPIIRRFYHWNMQYGERADIKGDFEVDARGSSVLLVKETQTQGLLQLMTFAGNAAFSPLLKVPDILRKLAQSMHISPDDIVLSDEEIAKNQAAQAQQQALQAQQVQLALAELQAKVDKLRAETTAKNVDAAYAGMQAGQLVAGMPALAPVADEILKSAGFVDHNGFPVAGQLPADGLPTQALPATGNTSPMFPGRPEDGLTEAMPMRPEQVSRPGAMVGIETPVNDGMAA